MHKGRYYISAKHGIAVILACLLLSAASPWAQEPQPPEGENVSFSNGTLVLEGLLYKPEGKGPFPALIFNHGSAPGMRNNKAFEQIAPHFTNRGWVFFAPYCRGQGLSESAGPFIGDEISSAQRDRLIRDIPLTTLIVIVLLVMLFRYSRNRKKWLRVVSAVTLIISGAAFSYASQMSAGAATMVRILETDHLDDHLAALEWIRAQPFTDSNRIATGGNSFGGIVTVLATEAVPYCAAFDAAGGARSWSLAPQLRDRMKQAVRNSQSPIFFFQAANDFSIEPSNVLSSEMSGAGKEVETIIYSTFGKSSAEGHSFAWRGSAVWADDVFRFLNQYCAAY